MLSWPQTIWLAAYYYRKLLLIGAALLFSWWILLPAEDQIDLNTCQPMGLLAETRAWAHGATFWRAQLPLVRKNLDSARNWDGDALKSKIAERAGQATANAMVQTLYASHPELAPSIAERWAQALRDRADEIEEDEQDQIASVSMRKYAVTLSRCEGKILDMK